MTSWFKLWGGSNGHSDSDLNNGLNVLKVHELHDTHKKKETEDEASRFLQARACPNEAIAATFGAVNSFTTTDCQIHRTFATKAKDAMAAVHGTHWKAASKQAMLHLGAEMHKDIIDLVPLVQGLTLKVMLPILFPTCEDRSPLRTEDLEQLGSMVNKYWLLAKTSHPLAFEHNHRLRAILGSIFPDLSDHDGKLASNLAEHNPMNLILPAYETMWRVALRGFLEVAFRGSHDNGAELRNVVIKASEPSESMKDDMKGTVATSDGTTAQHIAKESLRLYPPTRRVYRQLRVDADDTENFSRLLITPGTRVAADIEGLQRREQDWPNPCKFDPGRWRDIDQTKNKSWTDDHFLAFGYKPHRCPAAQTFGWMMVALLIGRLCKSFVGEQGGVWELYSQKDNDLVQKVLDRSKPLDNNREDYVDLQLRRTSAGVSLDTD